jgi:hypothetical protein
LVLDLLELDHGHREQADLAAPSIEHVLPQTLSDWWREHLGTDVEQHEALQHTIGNLTLTAYNSELSNSSFPEKRKALAESHYSLNAYFANTADWRTEQIDERAAALYKRALLLWPWATNFTARPG